MADELKGKRIAFLVASEGIEQVELTEPWRAVQDAGGEPELISLEGGEVPAFTHLDRAGTFHVDRTAGEADARDYDGLVLPGGVANPDQLRMDRDAVAFVRAFFEQAKPVGVICHGAWQIAPTGLPASKNARTKLTAPSSILRWSGFATPPGSTRPS